MSNLKLNKRMLALFLTATMIPSTLTACGKKAECSLDYSHAHLYTNDKGYVAYYTGEYLEQNDLYRNEENIDITGLEELYKFITKKNLLRIEDNLEWIEEIQNNNKDYTEYRYKYLFMQPIPHTVRSGKSTITYFTYIPTYHHSWTTDTSRMLTGETRICHHVYQGYKIVKNEKGKYELVESPAVDDITTIMDEYPYIKKKFVKIVNLDGVEVDYEDGKEEDLTDEEKQRIEEYNEENTKKLIKKNLE